MRLRTSPPLSRQTVARSRQLRRGMTPAEPALRAGIRKSFPDKHFRYQAPIGPYYADVVCHGARLVIEVDGSQHHEAATYDGERTAFLENQGYRVLRFWNNQVLRELDGVLAAIAAAFPSPLAGEGGAQRRMGGARRSRARTSGPHPLPSPPLKGEGFDGQPPVGVN
ncbi:endonuclease domain-containing protein [Enterovirga sp. GCM10030262]|uniref:endonuclease domain-containing protein n=1 Tax=Enterovirga sp. GCM10030262 TaxID=3273391 RepID=UPI003620878D